MASTENCNTYNPVEAETSNSVTSIITNYNKLYDKNTDLNTEIKNLRIIINTYETVLDERKKNCNDENPVQTVKQDEDSKLEKVEVSRENEDEVMKLTQVLNEKIEQYQMFLKSLINQVILEDDCENPNISYENVKDSLNMIDKYNCASDDPIRPLLEKSKTTICEMVTQMNTQNTLLTQYRCKGELCSRKLKQEIELSKIKDVEISKKDTDLNIFGDGYLEILKEKEMAESSLKKATEELNSYCCENKEYKSTISNLETKLCCVVKRLNESQIADKINNEKCNYLTIENSKLQKKVKRFDEICKQLLTFEDIIRGLEHQKIICEDINVSLVKEKNIMEQKLENINNELKCTINTSELNIKAVKSELSCVRNDLKNSHEENQSLKKIIESLKCDIENLNKLLEQEKYENENLVNLKIAAESHTEIIEKQLLNQKCLMSEKDNLVLENTRLTNEIGTQYTKSKYLLEEMNNLKCVNAKLIESVANYEKNCSKSMDHKGIQTNIDSNTNQPKTGLNECKINSCNPNDKNPCHGEPCVSNIKCICQCHVNDSPYESPFNTIALMCSCISNNCSCFVQSKTEIKCDCITNAKEKDLLNKLKTAQKFSMDTKRKYYDMEQEMQKTFEKSLVDKQVEYDNKLEELNAQLETMEINLMYHERDLNNALKREKELEKLLDNMKVDQQNKEKKLEHDEKKKHVLSNSLKKCKKQLDDMYKVLKSKNCKIIQLQKHIQAYDNLYKNQVKTTSSLEEKLEKLTKNTKKHCNENKNSKIDDEYNKSSKNNGLKCNRDCRPSNNNKITSDVKFMSSSDNKTVKNNENEYQNGQHMNKSERELQLIDSLLDKLKKNTKN